MKTLAISFFLLCPAAFGQLFSFGVRGGVPLTGGFSNVTTDTTSGIVNTFSGSDNYLIGPMVELHLPLGLGVEADALYHPLDLNEDAGDRLGVTRTSYSSYDWEFPILGKFHFLPFPIVKPYIDAGPSFRATGSGIASRLSTSGFTVGAGVEVKLFKLRVEPEFRYTRWGSDGNPPSIATIANVVSSDQNEVEFLVGVAF